MLFSEATTGKQSQKGVTFEEKENSTSGTQLKLSSQQQQQQHQPRFQIQPQQQPNHQLQQPSNGHPNQFPNPPNPQPQLQQANLQNHNNVKQSQHPAHYQNNQYGHIPQTAEQMNHQFSQLPQHYASPMPPQNQAKLEQYGQTRATDSQRCYNCNRTGHIARDCLTKKQKTCFKCNQPLVYGYICSCLKA